MKSPARSAIERWYRQALAAVDPYTVTADALRGFDAGTGRLVVLAIGKAAVPMAQAARDVFGDRISRGILVTKQGQYTAEVDGFVGQEAGHPIPTEASLRAADLLLDAVANLTSVDTVIALISGGGSALVEKPVGDISLAEMQVTTELLMFAGAGIHELNAVRKALSAIKGGGLRWAMGEARCLTLLLSDVPGNDHGIIASGLTVPEITDHVGARHILERFRIDHRVPESVRAALMSEMPQDTDIGEGRDSRRIIADNAVFVNAVAAAAQSEGLSTHIAWPDWRGDARDLGMRIVADSRAALADVLVGGGEATSRVVGDGHGGRNCETALVAAIALAGSDDWTVASLASDGDDGNSGAAGGIVDGSTVSDQIRALAALSRSDSAGFLTSTNDLLVPGPTGTNVNDVYIAVRNRALDGVTK